MSATSIDHGIQFLTHTNEGGGTRSESAGLQVFFVQSGSFFSDTKSDEGSGPISVT